METDVNGGLTGGEDPQIVHTKIEKLRSLVKSYRLESMTDIFVFFAEVDEFEGSLK